MAIFERYMEEMNKFNRSSQFPVLVVGVTSEFYSVPSRIQACFLHQIEMTPPNEPQRCAMLAALGLEYNLAPEIDHSYIESMAKQTAGFVLGDFVTLFISAFDKAFEETTKYRYVYIVIVHVYCSDFARG